MLGTILYNALFASAVKRILDGVITTIFTKDLKNRLLDAIQKWAQNLPDGYKIVAESLLIPDDSNDPTSIALIDELSRGRIPLQDDWKSALMEQCRRIRDQIGEDAEEFFCRSDEEIEPQLQKLAIALHRTCTHDSELFRSSQTLRMESIEAKLDQALKQLNISESISDSAEQEECVPESSTGIEKAGAHIDLNIDELNLFDHSSFPKENQSDELTNEQWSAIEKIRSKNEQYLYEDAKKLISHSLANARSQDGLFEYRLYCEASRTFLGLNPDLKAIDAGLSYAQQALRVSSVSSKERGYALRAWAYLASNRIEDAENDAAKALQLDKDYKNVIALRMAIASKRKKSAVEIEREFLLDSQSNIPKSLATSADVMSQMASCFEIEFCWEKAIEYQNRALDSASENNLFLAIQGHYHLSLAYKVSDENSIIDMYDPNVDMDYAVKAYKYLHQGVKGFIAQNNIDLLLAFAPEAILIAGQQNDHLLIKSIISITGDRLFELSPRIGFLANFVTDSNAAIDALRECQGDEPDIQRALILLRQNKIEAGRDILKGIIASTNNEEIKRQASMAVVESLLMDPIHRDAGSVALQKHEHQHGESWRTIVLRAALAMHEGDYELAEKLYIEAVAIDNESYLTLIELAMFYKRKDDKPTYSKILDRIYRKYPKGVPNEQVAFLQRYVVNLLDQKRYSFCKKVLLASQHIKPVGKTLTRIWAQYYWTIEEYESCEQYIREILEIDREDVNMIRLLSHCLIFQLLPMQAVEILENFANQYPHRVDDAFRVALASALQLAGLPEKASKVAKEGQLLAKDRPKSPLHQLSIALSLSAGHVDEALLHMQDFHETYPKESWLFSLQPLEKAGNGETTLTPEFIDMLSTMRQQYESGIALQSKHEFPLSVFATLTKNSVERLYMRCADPAWPMLWGMGQSKHLNGEQQKISHAKTLILDLTAVLALNEVGLLSAVLSDTWTIILASATVVEIINNCMKGFNGPSLKIWDTICKSKNIEVVASPEPSAYPSLGPMSKYLDSTTRATIRVISEKRGIAVLGDMPLGRMLREHGIETCSGMALINAMHADKIISENQYQDAIIGLHQRHHFFVPVSLRTLEYAWSKDGDKPGSNCKALFWSKIGEKVELESYFGVYGSFVRKLMADGNCSAEAKATIFEWYMRMLDARFVFHSTRVAVGLLTKQWNQDVIRECAIVLQGIAHIVAHGEIVGSLDEIACYRRARFRATSAYYLTQDGKIQINAIVERILAAH